MGTCFLNEEHLAHDSKLPFFSLNSETDELSLSRSSKKTCNKNIFNYLTTVKGSLRLKAVITTPFVKNETPVGTF